jgi:hypothetical protein
MPENFKTGPGRLAVSRYDFQHHVDGSDFYHAATSVHVSGLSGIGNPANVQAALGTITSTLLSGGAYVVIGTGYDTWHNANGAVNFDTAIPSIDTLLNPVFSAIYNGTTIPTGFESLTHGGTIFIKPGTYIIKDTITVPPSINIIGSGYGTKIINAIRLTTSSNPPVINAGATAKPMFSILADQNRPGNDGAINSTYFMFARETKLSNMMISDNFVEPSTAADVGYKQPQTTSGQIPLISQQAGSNLVLEHVYMSGRVLYSSGTTVSSATHAAVTLDTTTSYGTNGTFLTISNCFMDSFCIPVIWKSLYANLDHLNIENSNIRACGYLNGGSSDPANNCVVLMNNSNASLLNNFVLNNTSTSTNLPVYVFAYNVLSTSFPISIINISNNGGIGFDVKTSDDTQIPSKLRLIINTTIFGNTQKIGNNTDNLILSNGNISLTSANFLINANANFNNPVAMYGGLTVPLGNVSITNNLTISGISTFNGTTSFAGGLTTSSAATFGGTTTFNNATILNGATVATGSSTTSTLAGPTTITGSATIGGSYYTTTKAINGATSGATITSTVLNYTVGTTDYILMITPSGFTPSTWNSANINIPSASLSTNRVLIIKDSSGTAGSHNIIITTASGTIEPGGTTYTINTNYLTLRLVSDGSVWRIL